MMTCCVLGMRVVPLKEHLLPKIIKELPGARSGESFVSKVHSPSYQGENDFLGAFASIQIDFYSMVANTEFSILSLIRDSLRYSFTQTF